LFSDPYLLTRLAHLSSPKCVQPEANELLEQLYLEMGKTIANTELPRTRVEIPTRMAQQHSEAKYCGEAVASESKVIFVGLARAGTLPAIRLFEMYSNFLDKTRVRVDHIFINRSIDEKKHVTGAPIHGSKIGGGMDDAFLIIPDPMGATGNSICNVISHYKTHVPGKPKKWISLNLIVTPEFVQKLKKEHPEVVLYSLRLDRAFSSKRALESLPGEYPNEERGLNDQQYIVPGAGGMGEITSNSFV
jgi:uracil phosphoribosyltransferase